jgi:hypothetical protein
MVRYRTIPQGERVSVQFAKLFLRKLLGGKQQDPVLFERRTSFMVSLDKPFA